MQRLLAIAFLTLRAAFRFRLFLILAALLLGAVVALPLLIKDDGTARGFTQILLTYTLTVITALLGFATLWLACGALAREVEECQIQMVAVKPVSRWQIWLGKWLGIMLLNAILLALAGGAVFALLQWRAQRLLPEQREVLRNEVLVARGSAKEQIRDFEPIVDQVLQDRLEQTPASPLDRKLMRDQIREQVKAEFQLLRPSYARRWIIDLGAAKARLRDKPLFLRVRFTTTQRDMMPSYSQPDSYLTLWQIGVPESPRLWQVQMKLAADSFHEFEIPPNLFDENGRLTVICANPNDTDLLFLLEDGLEVLYHEGSFALNYARGLGIIYCWLALLAALGLAAASFLSFPVAAFVSMSVLLIGLCSGTIAQVIEEKGVTGVNPETGITANPTLMDNAVVAVFGALLKVINLVQGFSPIDSLSTGRSITWGHLAQAAAQIIFLMSGLLGVIGISLFSRRELAAAQGVQ